MEYDIINHECIKWVMMGYNLMLYHGNIVGISWKHHGFFPVNQQLAVENNLFSWGFNMIEPSHQG